LDDASWGNNNNWKKDVSESMLSQSKYIEGVKSANLFNKKGPFFIGAIQDTGLSSNSTNFITTDKIYVTAGKTYRRYCKPNTPCSFSTNCRYFDDSGYLGTMSISDTDVTIPSNASNPYIYITLYANPSGIGLPDYEQVMFLESTVDASKYIPYYTIDNIPIDYYKSCKNYGKSVGVFGGSLSVYAESDNAKNMWRNLLGMTVTNYGVPGAGFSSLQGTSVQQQVDGAGVHDIYILWCSTNDFGGNQQIGTYNDYTTADSYDNNKLVTQCGGINYAIKKLLEKNPLAEIYLFTSLKFFYSESGYNPFSIVTNTAGYTFKQYVDAQLECAKRFGIPVLDQFNLQGINEYNYTNYYNVDNLHMNANGYKKIGMVQVDFLSNGK
jgi:lysophospholipase L1-like esterase